MKYLYIYIGQFHSLPSVLLDDVSNFRHPRQKLWWQLYLDESLDISLIVRMDQILDELILIAVQISCYMHVN